MIQFLMKTSTEDISKPGPSGLQRQKSCSGQNQLDSPTTATTPKQQKLVIPSEISPVPILNPGKKVPVLDPQNILRGLHIKHIWKSDKTRKLNKIQSLKKRKL